MVGRVKVRLRAGAIRFLRMHRVRLESARFIDRVWMRERLAWDPQVEAGILEAARRTGEPIPALRDKVDAWVEEIAPYFSIAAYYRVGAVLARWFVQFCWELVVDAREFEAQAAQAPPQAIRVYVVNHRSNVDPLVLAFALLQKIALSYAVGEWALVWPLSAAFRAFGGFFVRRGEPDPLYHAVLERFVQLLAGHGAVIGFFPEGGLSRDGALRKPRTGLLEYLVKLRLEFPERDIVFLPIGLDYDRVLEDRWLVADKDGATAAKKRQRTLLVRVVNLVAIVAWTPVLVVANLVRVATRSHRKFGYVAVGFGEPLLLSTWPGGPSMHLLPPDERKSAVRDLGEELLYRRVGAAVPVTPVPVACTALLEDGPTDEASVVHRIKDVLQRLRAARAPLRFGEAFASIAERRAHGRESNIPELDAEVLDAEEAELVLTLSMAQLARRRIVVRRPKRLEVVERDVVAYYANAIRHHLDPAFLAARDAAARQSVRDARDPDVSGQRRTSS